MRIRYIYENKEGRILHNEISMEEVEDGGRKKFENGLSVGYWLKVRIVIYDELEQI